MSVWVQWLIIGVLAAIALVIAVWRIGTPRTRLRILDWLLAVLPGAGEGPAGTVRAKLQRRRAALIAKGGCAGCSH
jgi:hypothetical protein